MSKAILLSFSPSQLDLIIRGEKTLEIRKNKPDIKTPCKCYIYCTKGKGPNDIYYIANYDENNQYMGDYQANMTVCGEFICNEIERIDVPYPAYSSQLEARILEQSKLPYHDLHMYARHDAVYGFHISELKIYNSPKSLDDFAPWNSKSDGFRPLNHNADIHKKRCISPPHNWRYIDV
ncbi:ASCH domain-containing protein [bacterium]|nr:ASCH domain-containing protein [bacterium]